MTIDVALLRQLAERPNTSLVAYGPVVLLKPTTVTELLDAYEERDRLRDENERAAQLAVEATHLILRLREERERLRAALALAVSMVRGGEDFHVTGCEGCDSIRRALEGRE